MRALSEPVPLTIPVERAESLMLPPGRVGVELFAVFPASTLTGGAAASPSRYAFTEEITSGKVALGQFEPARVNRSRDVYTEYLKLKRSVPPEELYTNDLLPERK